MSNKSSNITNYLLPNISKYRLAEEIGSGAYGVVYKGFREDDGKNIALKRIFVTDKDGNNNVPLSTARELCALKKLNTYENKNIVRLYDVVLNKIEGKICMDLIFELGDYDLEKYLKKFNSSGEMSLSKIINLSKQLVDGIYFMHSHCIIHRDLKPANILINKDGTDIKITDFGLARTLGFDASLTPVVVTLWYRSPEILLQRSYLTACDIWSAGCIIAEMVYGRPVFTGENEISQIEKIVMRLGFEAINNWPEDNLVDGTAFVKLIDKARSFDSILKRVDPVFVKLIKEFLRFDPDMRVLDNDALLELDRISQLIVTGQINKSHTNKSRANCNRMMLPILNFDGDYSENRNEKEHEMIINSVVRKVLDDDDDDLLNVPILSNNNAVDNASITRNNHQKEEINGQFYEQYNHNSPNYSSTDDDNNNNTNHDVISSNSLLSSDNDDSITESCDEENNNDNIGDTIVEPHQQKDSDEVGDSFSSYRSQTNCSFSSYAPSSATDGANTTEDDDVNNDVRINKSLGEIADLNEFKESFVLSDKQDSKEDKVIVTVSDDSDTSTSDHDNHQPFTTSSPAIIGEKMINYHRINNSTPFKQINDCNRLTSPTQTQAKDNFMRKRFLNPYDSSDSENEMISFSPIVQQNNDCNNVIKANSSHKSHLVRQKSLRRRVSMGGPHMVSAVTDLRPMKRMTSLMRSGSLLITPISENEQCRDISFGEHSLARALDSVQTTIPTTQLSDRPKIVVRRLSHAKRN